MRLPQKSCCRACVLSQIDRALVKGTWRRDLAFEMLSFDLIAEQVPNRLPEIRAGTFGVASAARPFQGFSNVMQCDVCRERNDVCIMDARLFCLVLETSCLLRNGIDRAVTSPLSFQPVSPSSRDLARSTAKRVLFRSDAPTVFAMSTYQERPDSFLDAVIAKALTFAITHETSHMGPGAALGPSYYESNLASIAGYAQSVRATQKQTVAWAEELTTDMNAFSMIGISPFGPGRPQGPAARARWDDALLAGATFALKMVEVIQRAAYPHIPGVSVARQLWTVRHPPASLRMIRLWQASDARIRLGASASGEWGGSARNLAAQLEDLFDLPRLASRGSGAGTATQ